MRRSELGSLLVLAGPLIVAHAGNQLMSVADTAMVGRLGAAALGGVGIGNGILLTLTLFGAGCIFGLDAVAAQAVGAGEEVRARRALWQGLRVALWVGLPLTAVAGLSSLLVEPAGVQPDVAREVRWYLIGRMPNVLPFFLFTALRSYLQAKGITWPAVASMVVANLANVVGNYALIYGKLGMPRLGVMGSGLSSSAASVLSLVVVALAVRAVPAPTDPKRRAYDPELLARIFRLGVPLGLQLVAEVGIFALVGVLAGRMSPVASAAHQVALTVASFTFTVTMGIGAATSVRVGHHVGAGDPKMARRAGLLGLAASAAFMTVAGYVLFVAPAGLARALTDDPAVVRGAVPLLLIAALFQLSDGAQATAAGALRGAGDTRVPMWANVIGHYAIGLPVAVALGFHARMGAPGLWWGLSSGLTAVAIALTLRFLRLSSRPIARI